MKKPGSGVETEPGLNFTTLVNRIAPVPPKAGLFRAEAIIIQLATSSQEENGAIPANRTLPAEALGLQPSGNPSFPCIAFGG